MNNHVDIHAGFDLSNRVALYLEGQLCAFTRASISMQDGVVPTMSFSLPATDEARTISPRCRVHFLVREPVKDEWVVMFEGEVLQRGFQKSAGSRELSYVAHHVSAYYEQFAISSLNIQGKVNAALRLTKEAQEVIVGTTSGNLMEFFSIQKVAAANSVDEKNCSLPIYIRGAAKIYETLFKEHYIKNSYPTRAVGHHRLIDRLAVPDQMAFNWNLYYSVYIQGVMQGLKDLGGRISFMDFIRYIGSNFLHQVTVIPHAESYTKQIQFKPHTIFNIIPPCNVIYPCMAEGYSFQESYSTRPTRMEAMFQPVYDVSGEVANALPIQFTVFAPNELNFLWREVRNLRESPEKLSPSVKVTVNKNTGNGSPEKVIDFITFEEEQRGIVSAYYELPIAMTYAINAKLRGQGPNQASSGQYDAEKPNDQARQKVNSGSEDDRRLKYRAFLCTVLGDGHGIKTTKPSLITQSTDKLRRFRKRKVDLHWIYDPKASDFWPKDGTAGRRYIRPRRIVFLPMGIPVFFGDGKTVTSDGEKTRKMRDAEIQNLRANAPVNFFIDKTGNIIQVYPRWMTLFAQPESIPFGIRVKGLSGGDAKNLNANIPPYGQTRVEAKAKYETFTLATRGTPITSLRNASGLETIEEILARLQGEGDGVITTSQTATRASRRFTDVWVVKLPGGQAGRDIVMAEVEMNGAKSNRPVTRFPNQSVYKQIKEGDSIQITQIRPIIKEADLGTTVATGGAALWGPEDGKSQYAIKATAQEMGANVTKARVIKGADGDYFIVQVDRPIFDRDGFFSATIQAKTYMTSGGGGKPWVVMSAEQELKSQGGRTFSEPPVSMDALNQTGKDNVIPIQSLIGGPVGAVAIGLESSDGQITDDQAKAATWLSGVIMEMTAEKVGTLTGQIKDSRSRQVSGVSVTPDDLHEVADYFVGTKYQPLRVNGERLISFIKKNVEITRSHLYATFNTVDDAIMKGKDVVVSMADDQTITDSADQSIEESENLPVNKDSELRRAANRAQQNSPDVSAAGDVSATEVDNIDLLSLKLVAQIVNYQFYNIRYSSQSFSTNLSFNPYLLHGYPALILDNSTSKYHLVAYCYSINHDFTPSSVTTSATFTHVRPATEDERMIPYWRPRKEGQYHLFNIGRSNPKSKNPKDRVAFGSGAHKERLKNMKPNSLWIPPSDPYCVFPAQLLNWYTGTDVVNPAEKLPPHLPTAFVFDGGFGMGKTKNGQNAGDPLTITRYDEYLRFTGYVEGQTRSPMRDKLGSSEVFGDFVFADSPIFTTALDISDASPMNDANEAYRLIYRPIQKANQINPKKGACSAVAFAAEGVIKNPDGSEKERSMRLADLSSPPEKIFVISKDPQNIDSAFTKDGSIGVSLAKFKEIYIANGEKPGLGGVLGWHGDTQKKIAAHTEICRNHKALPG